jgi:hypothetical protein
MRGLDLTDLRALSTGWPAIAVVALIGFDPLPISLTRVGPRLALINGLHRAYALRSIGIQKVPAVIRGNKGIESAKGSNPPEFSIPHLATLLRPPLLRDFFDSSLSMTFVVEKQVNALTLTIEGTEQAISPHEPSRNIQHG